MSNILNYQSLLPLTGSYDGGISYQSLTDGLPYVLLLCSNGSIIRYNITKDKLKKLTKISKQLLLSPSIRDHFTLDIDNKVLYFCDDFFAIYKLNTNEWDIKCTNIQFDNSSTSAKELNYHLLGTKKTLQFLPNPVNELHIISNGRHIKYDNSEQKFIHLQHSNIPQRTVRHLIYMRQLKTLVLLLWNLDIWCCKITEKNQKTFEWKRSKLMLPFEYSSSTNYICPPMIAFDNFIVLFILCGNIHIWFLDMISNKAYKSDKMYDLSKKFKLTTVVKDGYDILHCIGSGFYHRICLTEILPTFQKNKFTVYGFVRCTEDEYDLYQQVPRSLTQLILSFYPSNL